MRYRYNPYCSCSRCRAHGYMGPAILITIGVLFLFDQMGHMYWMEFHFTWPAILIVIGVLMLLERGSSTNGHIPRQYGAVMPPNPQQPMPPGYTAPPVTPPPPVPPAGFITPGTGVKRPDDQGGA